MMGTLPWLNRVNLIKLNDLAEANWPDEGVYVRGVHILKTLGF